MTPGLGYTQSATDASKEMLDNFLVKIPTKKSITPEDIGNDVAFLAFDVSINIVGRSTSVDGGLIMNRLKGCLFSQCYI